MKTQMMAAVLYGKEHLQVEPVSIPKIDDGDILVRVRVALTCGTDVKVFRRGYHARMIVPPAVFGHELAGDVVAVGKDVKAFEVGAARGRRQFGSLRRLLLLPPRLAEPVRGSALQQWRLCRIHPHSARASSNATPTRFRSSVSYHDAALIEPLACVLKGFEETAPRPGDTIAILGLGPIGLMFVRLANLYGCRVIAIGRRRTQLERAEAMGADELVRADQHANTVQAVRDLTGGRGADIAIEAVGKPETWHWVAGYGAARRNRQLLRRLPQREPRDVRYQPAALLRNHLQGQFPSHARATSARRWTW